MIQSLLYILLSDVYHSRQRGFATTSRSQPFILALINIYSSASITIKPYNCVYVRFHGSAYYIAVHSKFQKLLSHSQTPKISTNPARQPIPQSHNQNTRLIHKIQYPIENKNISSRSLPFTPSPRDFARCTAYTAKFSWRFEVVLSPSLLREEEEEETTADAVCTCKKASVHARARSSDPH